MAGSRLQINWICGAATAIIYIAINILLFVPAMRWVARGHLLLSGPNIVVFRPIGIATTHIAGYSWAKLDDKDRGGGGGGGGGGGSGGSGDFGTRGVVVNRG